MLPGSNGGQEPRAGRGVHGSCWLTWNLPAAAGAAFAWHKPAYARSWYASRVPATRRRAFFERGWVCWVFLTSDRLRRAIGSRTRGRSVVADLDLHAGGHTVVTAARPFRRFLARAGQGAKLRSEVKDAAKSLASKSLAGHQFASALPARITGHPSSCSTWRTCTPTDGLEGLDGFTEVDIAGIDLSSSRLK